MSRAGPVGRAGSFSQDPGTSVEKAKNQVFDYVISGLARPARIPILRRRAEIFPCRQPMRQAMATKHSSIDLNFFGPENTISMGTFLESPENFSGPKSHS